MFSVVIPLYNKQESINNTLKCVMDQTFREFEVFVIDDGSTDRSEGEVQEIILTDSRFHLIKKQNGGVSSARNEGIRQSKFDYVAFLDADDFWEPTYLKEQSDMINDFPEASIWGLSWKNIIMNEKLIHKQDIAFDFRGIVKDYWKRNYHLYWTSAVVVRRSVFNEIGLFDERIFYGEDQDMWYRIILNYKVAFYNYVQAYYNQDAENRIMNKTIPRPNLKECFPFYIDKFKQKQKDKPDFIHYFHSLCAGYILPYFFGKREERILSLHVIENLNFTKIKNKYRLFYKTPYCFGYTLYLLFLLKQRLLVFAKRTL